MYWGEIRGRWFWKGVDIWRSREVVGEFYIFGIFGLRLEFIWIMRDCYNYNWFEELDRIWDKENFCRGRENYKKDRISEGVLKFVYKFFYNF